MAFESFETRFRLGLEKECEGNAMKVNPEQNRYAAMGVAALLPGMQYTIEVMQAKLDEMRALLAHVQESGAQPEPKSPRGGASWASLTPEERSTEMRRRMAVARGEAKPRTSVQSTALGRQRQKEWAAMSPRKRKERLAKMLAGRQAKMKERPAA
jgi:hypothetical protein